MTVYVVFILPTQCRREDFVGMTVAYFLNVVCIYHWDLQLLVLCDFMHTRQ
jgi:hypothetical protein